MVKNVGNSRLMGLLLLAVLAVLVAVSYVSCGSKNYNTNFDSHFTPDGELISDSTDFSFSIADNIGVCFYVEVSGSMNGFFRANRPTDFKRDVWNIITQLNGGNSKVTILTNDGSTGATLSPPDFQSNMNAGGFVSTASTRVPTMLNSIINNMVEDEVAVLISDMKYSPVGELAPAVLLTQYSSDINRILGGSNKAISVVGATSNYLDRTGNNLTDYSPYYFVILGKDTQVARVRNTISTLLELQGHFVDNIDSGFDYGHASYKIVKIDNGYMLPNCPSTIVGIDGDDISFKLEVDLEPYRWLMANEEQLRESFTVEAKYGSNVEVGDIQVNTQNITNQRLNRKVTATISLKITGLDNISSDVLEWNINLKDDYYLTFGRFLGATTEDDVTKSYSLDSFFNGIYCGGILNKPLKPNYILLSKVQ